MTHSSERDTQPVPRIKPGSTQQLPTVQKKYNPRHKKENNTGFKFLAVLAGLVLFLGLIAWVDWASLDDNKNQSNPKPTVVTPTVTETVTETAPGKSATRTVTSEPSPGPTTTITMTPSATPGPTVTQTVEVTATYNQPVPGPTVTKTVPGPTATKTVTVTPLPTGD